MTIANRLANDLDHILARGGPIRVNGDGSPLRSYLYASDLMVWLWAILFKGRPCPAYNVGSEDALNIAALPQKVRFSIAAAPAPGAQPHRYVPSTAQAREELGLRTEVPLREAIHRTHAWFAEQSPTKPALAPRGAHA